MADVDLIPGDYSKAQLARRRVKQLLIACVSVFLFVGAARLALSVVMSFEKLSIARLEKEGLISTRSKAEADSYREQKQLAEKQLAELDELRGRDRLKLLLHAIDVAHSDSIWLDELRFLRREHVPAGSTSPLAPGGARSEVILVPKGNVPGPGVPPPATGTQQRVEMIGQATNHTRLAEFMRGLSAQPGILDVRVLDTGMGTQGNSPVINLTLMLLVDDKARKTP